jgi:DNA invertase Pin-like site-specific DNA recombinase
MIAEKGVGFKSLRDTWADTTTAHGRLMLTVLGGLAEFERELIRTRPGEGRQRAKARGVILGQKPKLTSLQRREAIARRDGCAEASENNPKQLQAGEATDQEVEGKWHSPWSNCTAATTRD